MPTYDSNGQPVEDPPTWNEVRTGEMSAEAGQIEPDESGAPAVTITVTPKGSNVLGLGFLAVALYFLMSGRDS